MVGVSPTYLTRQIFTQQNTGTNKQMPQGVREPL
jgi:hypothetical protein